GCPHLRPKGAMWARFLLRLMDVPDDKHETLEAFFMLRFLDTLLRAELLSWERTLVLAQHYAAVLRAYASAAETQSAVPYCMLTLVERRFATFLAPQDLSAGFATYWDLECDAHVDKPPLTDCFEGVSYNLATLFRHARQQYKELIHADE
ncbi:MAG: hypothetical protein ACK4SA_15300, partial [Caldilinea sp.]